jgi:pimeloyl-ACP methyl ester carboxylesterase
MATVTSKDGTTIAYEEIGQGPAIILVTGGSVDSQSNAGLASVLAPDFTVYNYERRGRGASGDTLPYAVEREIEDIDAVVDAAGGSAYLYGTSSGAALAMEAAARLGADKITKLVLWEPPYIIDAAARPPADSVEQYKKMLDEGRRGDAAEFFMAKVVGMPPEFVEYIKTQPIFEGMKTIAHTLPYDGTIMGDYSVPTETATTVKSPTIVVTGSASMPFMASTAAALAEAIPGAETRTLDGQQHNVDPAVLGPVIREFLTA